MPERPGDRQPAARAPTDRERAEAARLREIARRAPPPPAAPRPFPTEPPWSAELAELVGLWLDVRCRCRAHANLPLRYLAGAQGWTTRLRDAVDRLRCSRCGERPSSVELAEDPAAGAPGMPRSAGKTQRLRLI